MRHQDDPKNILRGLSEYMAYRAAIPVSWLKAYSQYNPAAHRVLVRIDCMEVTFSSWFNCGESDAKEAEKLLPEIDKFVMLLWGEPK